jgi:hypothetical protein
MAAADLALIFEEDDVFFLDKVFSPQMSVLNIYEVLSIILR